jgi:hypothetical protein
MDDFVKWYREKICDLKPIERIDPYILKYVRRGKKPPCCKCSDEQIDLCSVPASAKRTKLSNGSELIGCEEFISYCTRATK